MRIILILTLSLIISPTLFAQSQQDDVVYLKNGTFLRGRIVERYPGQYLRLAVALSSDTLQIRMDEVDHVGMENPPAMDITEEADGFKAWRYIVSAELSGGAGYLDGSGEYGADPGGQYSFMADVVNSFTVSRHVQWGIGIGIDFWKSMKFVPIYLDLRVNLSPKPASLFVYFDGGYSFGWMYDIARVNMGGVTAGTGLGFKIPLGKKPVFSVSLGYKYQRTTGQWQDVYPVKEARNGHFAVLKTGIGL